MHERVLLILSRTFFMDIYFTVMNTAINMFPVKTKTIKHKNYTIKRYKNNALLSIRSYQSSHQKNKSQTKSQLMQRRV